MQTIRVSEDITEVIKAQRTIQQQNEELASTLEELQAAEEQLREMNEELEYRVEVRTRELAESERKLKQSEEQLRLITDSMPAFISYIRKDVTYGFVNKAYEKLFQIKREDIVGKPAWKIIGKKAYQSTLPLIESALNGEHVESEILQDYGKVGKKWMRTHFVPHSIKGKIAGTFVLIEDISNLKKIQLEQEVLLKRLNKANKEKEKALKQLEKKNQDLERTNVDLDNFIYTASHDLKSPITNMEGLISLLRKSAFEKVEPKERQLLEMMDTSVQRLQKTIGDLVEITKYQKGSEDIIEEALSFTELNQDVKEGIHHLLKESNALIKENFQVSQVVYRKSNLRSILYNLLSNAAKYRNPDRPLVVELKTFVQDHLVVLSVKDNGLGLNPNQQKKLFTLFRRMHRHAYRRDRCGFVHHKKKDR